MNAFRALPRFFGMAAGGVGLVALSRWILGLPFLATFGTRLIPMAPSTALLFTLFGLALSLANRYSRYRSAYVIGITVSSIGAVSGLVFFVLSTMGIYLRAEHLWIQIAGAVDGAPIAH